ncbi:MAG: DUF3025 domain-containing protein [Proteobacteria bacterium]|nr:DUF3025 domain-containing protein [Pseudomonadota bacterium]MBS0493098.1 DUF3025 domain-containing protein [Pseudomonadota bacterium]
MSFAAIDWQRPWLAHIAPLGCLAAQRVQAGATVAQALNALVDEGLAPSPGVRFVSQVDLPAGVAYEEFIFTQSRVPTRDNLHDFFNGLIWLHYPATKRRFNRLQGQAISRDGVGARRGALRDALTLFDENGALLLAPRALKQALAGRQWRRLCVELRPLWREARLLILGHALLEKLVSPRKSITAHVYHAQTATETIVNVDHWLGNDMAPEWLSTKPFHPLPVLGVPGWWPENENFSFYDDSLVFRGARLPSVAQASA